MEYKTIEPPQTVNVVIAAYTTAQAILKLYDFLSSLDDRVQYEPPMVNFLGDLTDELQCYGDGTYITEFVRGGPKSYAYEYCVDRSENKCSTNQVCKIKGFTLNYKNSKN